MSKDKEQKAEREQEKNKEILHQAQEKKEQATAEHGEGQEMGQAEESEQNEGRKEEQDLRQMEGRCAQLEEELEQLRARYARLAADFDNFRKRTERQNRELVARAGEKLICDIIPVLDTFEHALASAADNQAVAKGIEMIRSQLLTVLQREGLEPIQALGQPFDPELHEACSFAETDAEPENTVVNEIRSGYKLAGKVIRPSMVQVSKLMKEDDNG